MVLLVLIFVGVVVVAYAADRVWKARTQFRRLHKMNSRLTAATARAERHQEQVVAREQASAELTAFMPAINRPPSSLPGMPAHRKAHKAGGRERSASPASRPDNRPAADRAPRRPAVAAPRQSPDPRQSPEQPQSPPQSAAPRESPDPRQSLDPRQSPEQPRSQSAEQRRSAEQSPPQSAEQRQSQSAEQAQSPERQASAPELEPSPKLSAEPLRPDQLEDTLL